MTWEQLPTCPTQCVFSQAKNHASSVSLHCIIAWSWSAFTQALYGGSIGEHPIAATSEQHIIVNHNDIVVNSQPKEVSNDTFKHTSNTYFHYIIVIQSALFVNVL